MAVPSFLALLVGLALARIINACRAQQLRAETALHDFELKLKTNLLMMPLAAMEMDKSGKITSWNPAAELMFGYLEKEVLGQDVIELIAPERIRRDLWDMVDKMISGEIIDRHVNTNVTKYGREIVCEWYNTPLYDSKGEWVGYSSLVRDITEQQAEAEKILYLSRHDPLTGLLNRRSMQEKLDAEWQRCQRTGGKYSTIMLDIDKFKLFNDRYGHECGDVVLKSVADSLTQTIRSTDSVGRWGGEEFLVLMPETDLEGGIELAEKIRQRIGTKATAYNGRDFKVTVTAGVAVGKPGDESVDVCVRRADKALLAGKSGGRNRVVATP